MKDHFDQTQEHEHDFWGPRIRTLGDHIEEEFPGLGSVVLLLPFYRLGNVAYISNARREDIVSMMKDTVRQFEEGLEKPVIGDFVNSDEISEFSIHEDYRSPEAAEAMFRACKQLFPSLQMEVEIDDNTGTCNYKITIE
jgi:hypothetical protein